MSRRAWILLGLVTALAAFLRFNNLDSLPPGLFGDEALVTLHAREAVETASYPIYFAQQDGGFHPAIVYLTMFVRWLTNNHPQAIRFGVAAVGALSIPIAFFCLREIYRLDFDEATSTLVAGLGALILAITFPYMLITRLGFEVSFPVIPGALTFGFLTAGLRTGERRFAILAGIALGLSLYTYYSARLLPVGATLAVGWVGLVAGRGLWRRQAGQWLVIAIASALVFAPLGVYFLQNPSVFFARAVVTGENTLGQGPAELPARLLNSTWRTLASLSVDGFGDFIPRHNIPWRAVFDPFLSLLFWVGLSLALWRWARRSSALLGSWLAVMLLPVILTMNLNSPHFTRMAGAMPALAGLAGLGALAVLHVFSAHRAWGYGFLGIGLAFSTLVTTYDYFVRWADDPALFDAFQVGGWRAANLALEGSQSGLVLLSPDLIDDPSDAAFNVLLRHTPARQFPGPDCLVYIEHPTEPMTYISSTLHDARTFDRVHALYPTGREGETMYHEPDPWPLYQVFNVPAGAVAQPPPIPLTAQFADQIELIGYDLNAQSLHPGDTLQLTLYWRAQQTLTADYNAFIHLYSPGSETAAQPPIAQTDGAPCQGKYVTSRWKMGEVVVDERTLTLPPDFVADSLPLGIGLYGWPSLERLPVSATMNVLPDRRYLLTTLSIRP